MAIFEDKECREMFRAAEIAFLISVDNDIIPIEVKAATNTRARSFREFLRRYSPRIGFNLSMKNIGDNRRDNTYEISLPLYIAGRIERYI